MPPPPSPPNNPALLAGVDEVGRGCLAGPVCAAAVILDPERPIDGLADSKTLSPARRNLLARQIRDRALGFALGSASVEEIERLNILHASLLAMRRAVIGLSPVPQQVWVDGNRVPDLPMPARACIGGDQSVPSIAAASILAKVCRDRLMTWLAAECPGYDFARHKGYGTAAHLQALGRLGVSRHHRRGFAPVRRLLEGRGG